MVHTIGNSGSKSDSDADSSYDDGNAVGDNKIPWIILVDVASREKFHINCLV